MSDSEAPEVRKAAPAASSVDRDMADEHMMKYEADGDDLMGAIGIDLEEGADIAAGPDYAPAPSSGSLEAFIDVDKISGDVSRAVLEMVSEKISHMLVRAIEEAVGAEMEKLKDLLNR